MHALPSGAQEWTTLVLAIVFVLGAFMIYWLFYTSKLVPRWLSGWGLIGGVLYLSAPFLRLAGLEGFGALMAPLSVQEMVLASWLILKGFDVAGMAALASSADSTSAPFATPSAASAASAASTPSAAST